MQTLDVRPIPPRVRHETIFDQLDRLATGETLRLVNDHDPAPLRYQLDATPARIVPVGRRSVSRRVGGRHHQSCPGRRRPTRRWRPVANRSTRSWRAAGRVADGEVLVVYAPFEPLPLEGVLGEQGFTHIPGHLEGGDWRVTFARG